MITEEITNPAPAYNPEPFNWDSTSNKGAGEYSAEERTKMEQQYDQTLSAVVEHDIVDGKVVSISSKDKVLASNQHRLQIRRISCINRIPPHA